MDIAAAFPAKTPQKPDAARVPRDAADPYTNDFSSELDAAADAPDAPREKPKAGAKGTPSAAESPETIETSQPPGAPAEIAPPAPAVPTIAVQPVQLPEAGAAQAKLAPAAQSFVVPGASQASAEQTPVPTAATATTPGSIQPEHALNEILIPAGAGTSVAPATQAAAAAPPPEGLSVPKPVLPKAKTNGEAKTDAAAATPPATAASTAAPASTTAPAAPNAGAQSGAPQDDANKRPAGEVQTAQSAQAHQPAPQTPEFKPDASAAATAPQPATAPAQNAPPAAAALTAQNAPIFVPPEALGVAIARKAIEGVNKFELRLDPPELGRLEVTLEVDEAGHTRAHIRAERPEALELLQREAKGMEQALRQAGLTLDPSSLSFSLTGRDAREAHDQQHHGRRAKFTAVLPEDEIHAAALRGPAPSTTGLDLRV